MKVHLGEVFIQHVICFSGNSWPKLPFLKHKKLRWNFFDRKWPPPPPFGNFPEIHSNPGRQASLREDSTSWWASEPLDTEICLAKKFNHFHFNKKKKPFLLIPFASCLQLSANSIAFHKTAHAKPKTYHGNADWRHIFPMCSMQSLLQDGERPQNAHA